MDITVLQRFDAIFILLDEANYEQDRAIGLSVLGRSTDPSNVPLEIDFVRKYIAYAKTYNPELSKEAEDYIATQHAEKRQASKSSDYLRSHRQVPALRRLSLAAARFDLQSVATVEHVKCAEEILATSLNERDAGQMAGDEPEEVRGNRRSIAKMLVDYAFSQNTYENIDYRFVVDYAKEQGHDLEPKQIKELLTSFSKNHSVTGVKKNKDGTFNYSGAKNPAYEMW
jgi:DNA replicative helicase MCM subunit Mcm2 (Cdc46/Mcm family)